MKKIGSVSKILDIDKRVNPAEWFQWGHVPAKMIKRLQIVYLMVHDERYVFIPTTDTMNVYDNTNTYTTIDGKPVTQLDMGGDTYYVLSVHHNDVYVAHTVSKLSTVSNTIDGVCMCDVMPALESLGLVKLD